MDEFFLPDDTSFWWQNITGYGTINHFLMVPNAEHSEATGILELLPAVGTFLEAVVPANLEAVRLGRTTITNAKTGLPQAVTVTKVPQFAESIAADGTSITVTMDKTNAVTPHEVSMWSATTCDNKRRDFRIVNKYTNVGQACSSCGVAVKNLPFGATCLNTKILWGKTVLKEDTPGSGRYVARQTPKSDGRWTAYFIDATFDSKATKPNSTSTSEIGSASGWPVGHDGYFEFTSEVSIIPQTFPFPDCKGTACRGKLL